jgi:hypothetical protein
LRPIRLEPWQELLVKEATEEFIRGLIDSDGCRVVANDRGVKSVRYHFSNRSDDIRALFCAVLCGARPSGNSVDVSKQISGRRLPQGGDGTPRRIHRAESVMSPGNWPRSTV